MPERENRVDPNQSRSQQAVKSRTHANPSPSRRLQEGLGRGGRATRTMAITRRSFPANMGRQRSGGEEDWLSESLVKRAFVANRFGRYAAAAGAVLLAAAGQFALEHWVGGMASFAVFFPAIVAGALLGAGPGALGLGLSLAIGLAAMTWTAGPAAPGGRDWLEFSLFGLSGAIIVLITAHIAGGHRRSVRPVSCSRRSRTFRSRGSSSTGRCSIAMDRFAISNIDTPIRRLARS
jgi:hypothetical protein